MNKIVIVVVVLFSTIFSSVFAVDEGGVVPSNYVLRPKDVFRMEVFQEPDLEQEARVAADGTVTLPLIGNVTVGGMTVGDAQDLITELYNKDYLVNPHITLLVLVFTERRVEILGAINRPGPVSIPPEEELTLTKAISGASGHSRLANLKKVRLTRIDDSGKPRVVWINFEEISRGKAKDIQLQDGDSIFIEERIF